MTNYPTQLNFFKEAILKGKLSHSYILSGIEDEAYAKSIAKMILCKQEHTGCDSCSSCVKLASDNHPDYMIIVPDGASIKNAQVEAFQEFIFIRPFESKHKIVVFSQMQLMTERAQNRILKVLEEPPEYAIFLFLTTNLEGILETVISRCQVLNFFNNSGQNQYDNNEVMDKAFELIKSIEISDRARILEFGVYAKQDKARFVLFMRSVSLFLRDILIFLETGNYQLISAENLTILNYKEQLGKMSKSMSRRRIIQLIMLIDDVELKIKNNMNFDLTVDKLLFKCIE